MRYKFCKNSDFLANMQLFQLFYVRGIVGVSQTKNPFSYIFSLGDLLQQYSYYSIVRLYSIYKLSKNSETNKNSMDKKKCIIDKYNTVYGFNLFVILNPDKSTVDKRFSFRNDESSIMDDEWADYTAYTVRGAYDKLTDEDCEVIVINKLNNTSDDINIFAHESFHAAVDVLEACHINLSDDTNEVFAYLIGYFTECVNKTASKV